MKFVPLESSDSILSSYYQAPIIKRSNFHLIRLLRQQLKQLQLVCSGFLSSLHWPSRVNNRAEENISIFMTQIGARIGTL